MVNIADSTNEINSLRVMFIKTKLIAVLAILFTGGFVSAFSSEVPDEIPGLYAFSVLELDISTVGQQNGMALGPGESKADKKGRQPLTIQVRIDNADKTLELEPYSVRSKDFQLFVQGQDAQLNEVTAPAPCTYRGVVAGDPNSVVIASVSQGKLKARIELGSGDSWQIQPVSDLLPQAASQRTHIVYRKEDVTVAPGVCGVDDSYNLMQTQQTESAVESAFAFSGFLKMAEIAIDADYEYYQLNGSSVNNTLADIEAVMNDVTDIYLRDVIHPLLFLNECSIFH